MNVVVRPTIRDVELVGIVCGYAGRADGKDALVFALPRVLGDEVTLEVDVVLEWNHCVGWSGLRFCELVDFR